MEEGQEVILAGRVWKEVLTPGLSRISQKPTESATCVLNIENIRTEPIGDAPTSVDLSSQHTVILTGETEVTVVIGEADSEIDKRIEMAIQLMKDGEKARITIAVPNSATDQEVQKLSFEATLLKHKRSKPVWEWTPEEKYEIAMRYKERGVKLFKGSEFSAPRYKDAFHRFSRACKILITLEPIDDLELNPQLVKQIETLRHKLYLNMASCQSKHNNYDHVVELCAKVLSRDEKNTTALYRRGCAYGELKDYEKAVQDFTNLLNVDPNNNEAVVKAQQYRACLRQANIRCNEMVKKMFQ